MNHRALLFLMISILAGCSSPFSERIPCPKAVIVAELSKTVKVQEGIEIHGEMDSLRPVCEADGSMEIRLRFTAFRPSLQSKAPLLFTPSYFVAILDKAGNLLSRSDHTATLSFGEGFHTAVGFQDVKTLLPSLHVVVYVGFNLDETQLLRLEQERRERATGKAKGRRP